MLGIASSFSRKLIINEKYLDTLKILSSERVRLLALEGPARSGKTAVAIEGFYRRVYHSSEKYHAITAQSLTNIENNILNADIIGLLVAHQNIKWASTKVGSKKLVLIGADGKCKYIRFASYSNKASWKQILGSTLGVILVDEANTANIDFLRELFARQASVDSPLMIMTTNGDEPSKEFYQEFVNHCKIIGECPASTRKFHEDTQKEGGAKTGYYYCFFALKDNPIMTTEKIRRFSLNYPVGSYYYKTKFLGERGSPGHLIFADYLNEGVYIDAFEKISGTNRPRYQFVSYTIGVDIGANCAHNVVSLTGWTANYRMACILKTLDVASVGYAKKTQFINNCLRMFIFDETVTDEMQNLGIKLNQIEGMFVDSAEQNYIADLRGDIKKSWGIDVYNSYKATIKERIDMMIIGFSTGKIKIHKNNTIAYESYSKACWEEGKEGQIREDNNEVKNDVMDAIEYSLTRHMKALMIAQSVY